jgi:hypothetical protein
VPTSGGKDHALAFCQDAEELTETEAEYLRFAVEQGVAVAVVALDRRRALAARLADAGTDVAAARENGSYVELDPGEIMSQLIVNGWPDPAGFWQTVSPVLRRAAANRHQVRMVSELCSLLWEAGLADAAIDVEALWDELGAHYPVSVLCAYQADVAREPGRGDEVAQLCGAHSHVSGDVPGGGA